MSRYTALEHELGSVVRMLSTLSNAFDIPDTLVIDVSNAHSACADLLLALESEPPAAEGRAGQEGAVQDSESDRWYQALWQMLHHGARRASIVVSSWEHGDLAQAVRELDHWLAKANRLLDAKPEAPKTMAELTDRFIAARGKSDTVQDHIAAASRPESIADRVGSLVSTKEFSDAIRRALDHEQRDTWLAGFNAGQQGRPFQCDGDAEYEKWRDTRPPKIVTSEPEAARPGDDSYQLTVTYTRSRSDDTEVCERTGRTLAQQLAAELQGAADEGLVAGSFQVRSEDD